MIPNSANTAHRAVPRTRLFGAAIVWRTPSDDIELKAGRIAVEIAEVRQVVREFSEKRRCNRNS
uniref:Uncharacterized protein n=1 Tax=uncultured marine group II/III euryarchaeote KM3_87_B04 TaxID=1456530 RepID=A0A075HUZ0_9EURY|nr:hypothetical protein [uncultured marine group II/III euryarchaeote KM3_87_B04]